MLVYGVWLAHNAKPVISKCKHICRFVAKNVVSIAIFRTPIGISKITKAKLYSKSREGYLPALFKRLASMRL